MSLAYGLWAVPAVYDRCLLVVRMLVWETMGNCVVGRLSLVAVGPIAVGYIGGSCKG